MTTYTDVITALGSLEINEIRQRYKAGPPVQLSGANLPAMWCDMPHGEERPACAGKGGGDRTINIDLVVAVQAVGQDMRLINWPAAVAMMDSIAEALRAWDSAGGASPFMSPITWRSKLQIIEVAGIAYWAIVTEIEGLG